MKKVLLKGPVLSQSGYGVQARFALRSLLEFPDEFDIYILNTDWGKTGWIWEDNEERALIDRLIQKTIPYTQRGGKFDVSLQVLTPLEFERLAPENIGYTAGIETTKIAKEWLNPSQMMDRIIVTSHHAAYGMRNTSYDALDQNGQPIEAQISRPILPVSYYAEKREPKKLDLKFDHDFNFLVVAQWGIRKNIEQTIRGFVEEFIDKDVGLVLKLSTMNNSLLDRNLTENRLKHILSSYEDRKCSVHLLHGDMTDEEMAGLYTHPQIKALVNIAHGEGFGLPIFEAATYALPIVTLAWSGQNDFLWMPQKDGPRFMATEVSYDLKPIQQEAVWDKMLVPESLWAYPKNWKFKAALREVHKSYKEKQGIARKLQKHILKNFEEKQQKRKFAEIVAGQQIFEPRKVEDDEVPLVSVITSVYNGLDYLEDFLKDYERQTLFQKDKTQLCLIHPHTSPSFEEEKRIIFEWMNKKEMKDKNVCYQPLPEDPGIYGCWNSAIEVASGEFITNANLDDRKSPTSLEEHAKELVRNPGVELVYADSFVTQKPNETFEENTSNKQVWFSEPFTLEGMFRGNQPHNNPMWRKSLHEECGMFDASYRSAGDWDFFLRCAVTGKQFKKINKVLGLYYFNPTGISTNPEHNSWKQEEEKRAFETNKQLFLQKQQEAKEKEQEAIKKLEEHGLVF